MSISTSFLIPVLSDQALIEGIRRFLAETSLQLEAGSNLKVADGITVRFAAQSEGQCDLMKFLSSSKQRTITEGSFVTGLISIGINPGDGELTMKVNVSKSGDANVNALEFAQSLASLKRLLHHVVPGIGFQKILRKEATQYYAAREESLSRLEATTQTLIECNTALMEKHEELFAARVRDLEADAARREADRTAEHAQRLAALESRQSALDATEVSLDEREANLDLQASRIERRNTIKTLVSRLEPENSKLTLEVSDGTKSKRNQVWWGAVTLLACLLGLNVFLYLRMPVGTVDYVATGRSLLATISFVTAFVYFLRWQNHWADRHASEEFRLKKMLLDVRRANLLIETALEWETENEAKIPDQLLEILSRNLFIERDPKHEAMPPVESLLSLIVAQNEHFKIKSAVAEVEASANSRST